MRLDELSEEQKLELKQRILEDRNEHLGEGTSYGGARRRPALEMVGFPTRPGGLYLVNTHGAFNWNGAPAGRAR